MELHQISDSPLRTPNMFKLLCLTALLAPLGSAGLIKDLLGYSRDVEIDLDAEGLAKYYGYPVETHIAQTEDNWNLQLHRIPAGRGQSATDSPNKKVVIFQHGFECASDNWMLNFPENSAAFLFADAGYDVWLPNSRGNKYATHSNYSRYEPGFWNYTYDQMVQYDLPATFDKIEEVTGQSKFYYVGHSQGTVIMFAKLASDPSFADRIIRYFATGPATSLKYLSGPFALVCDTLRLGVTKFAWGLLDDSELGSIILDPTTVTLLDKLTCAGLGIQQEYCAAIFFLLGGFSSNTNVTRVPVYFSHIPAGVSVGLIHHHCQSVTRGDFKMFDFPFEKDNWAHYGAAKPPTWDLSQVRGKIHFYSSPEDIITPRQALLEYTFPHLNNSEVEIEDNVIEGFSHMDFLWGLNVTELVYKPILATMKADDE